MDLYMLRTMALVQHRSDLKCNIKHISHCATNKLSGISGLNPKSGKHMWLNMLYLLNLLSLFARLDLINRLSKLIILSVLQPES